MVINKVNTKSSTSMDISNDTAMNDIERCSVSYV